MFKTVQCQLLLLLQEPQTKCQSNTYKAITDAAPGAAGPRVESKNNHKQAFLTAAFPNQSHNRPNVLYILCAHLDIDKAALSNDWKCRNYNKRFLSTVKVFEIEKISKNTFFIEFSQILFLPCKYVSKKQEKLCL